MLTFCFCCCLMILLYLHSSYRSNQTQTQSFIIMEASNQAKEVVLCDIEKAVDLKMLTQYLIATKAMDAITKFTKSSERFLLQFRSQKDAEKFIRQRAFSDKIIKRKFNLYLASFEDKEAEVETFIINGLNQQVMRKAFEICNHYANCSFILKYEGENIKGTVHFFKGEKGREAAWVGLIQNLKEIKVNLGQTEQREDDFMCSIELINFEKVSHLQIDQQERIKLQESLRSFMLKISEKQIKSMEVKTYLHKENILSSKAYFRYNTTEDTFEVFQRLRIYLLQLQPLLTCRIFYYSKQANTFRTLFTNGLHMDQNISLKQFQNQLIESFRKITPGVVQVLLKECPGRIWTGKIYLKDQASGKLLASQYVQKRAFIYMHYKDKSKILINLFQDKQAMSQIRRYQNNAERMLDHIRSTHEREKQMIPLALHQPQHRQFAPRPVQSRKQQRFKEKEVSKQEKNQKRQNKVRYKPKEQQFPSI